MTGTPTTDPVRRGESRDPLQDALRQSEEQFEQLVAGVEDYAIYMLSPDGLVRSWNSGARRQLGYATGEIIGEDFARFYEPDAAAAGWPARQLAAAAEAGRFSAEEWRVRRDGTRFRAAITITPLRGEEGRRPGFLVITRDLTERLEAEELLRRSEEHFRLLVEGVREYAIFLLDPAGTIQSWNSGAQRINGYAAAEVIGSHFSIFYPPDAIAAGKPGWELRVALEQGSVEDEGWRIRKGGQRFWSNVVITALRDENGKHVGFAKITRDMTDRRREAETLRRHNQARLLESEERFARFAGHLPGLAWIKDLEGRYVYVNDAAVRAFGASRDVITGRTDAEIFPPDTAAAFAENDRRALAGGTGLQVIEYLRDPEGTLRHSIVSKFPILGADGRPHLLGGIAIDVTERVQAEQDLRRADRLKDEFLAMLSHELRNPLAPIRNGLHLLRSAAPPADAGRIHEMMEHQLERLIRLVDDLLEVSRIRGGKVALRREAVELAGVLQAAIETSAPYLERGRHELRLALPDEPLVLDADAVRLGQILSNLLNNAAKYTNEGGHIRVTARREGDTAVISVRDDGIGIPAEMMPRVFDMFTQVDRTLKRAQGGLGIGLALAKNLVELHGGRIEARSEGPGRGSEFIVRMPLSARSTESRYDASTGGERLTPGTAKRILVVDDSRDGADSLGMVLKMMGAEPEVVYDGPSAIEAIRARRPATVLLDIGMPGMDGYEVAARIRSDPELSGLRLIALTGWGSEEERRKSQHAGFDEHWVKPVDPAKLRMLLAADGA